MVAFVAGQPVTTDTPGMLVDAGLPVGRHRFQLVVTDSGGMRSRADEIVVQVQRLVLPPVGPIGPIGPAIDPVDPVRPVGPVGPIGPVIGPVIAPSVIGQPTQPVRPQRAARRTSRRKS